MLLSRIRRRFAAHHMLWCGLALALTLLQPFVAAHFRCDGLEDEPMLRVRSVSDTTQFETDDRPDHAQDRETTLFAQTGATTDLPNALSSALAGLLAMIFAQRPMRVALAALWAPAPRQTAEQVPQLSGAPPLALPWRRLPPMTAPPSST